MILQLIVGLIGAFWIYSLCHEKSTVQMWFWFIVIDVITLIQLIIASYNAHFYLLLGVIAIYILIVAFLQAVVAKFSCKHSSSFLGFLLIYAVSHAVVMFASRFLIDKIFYLVSLIIK